MDKKKSDNKAIGAFGEDAAACYLENKGYIIKDRNFRAGKIGELDIIAQYNDILCFIEVKTRKNLNFGTPAESVTYSKIRNIKTLAQIYMKNQSLSYADNVDTKLRFDVIEVLVRGSLNSLFVNSINHIENAF